MTANRRPGRWGLTGVSAVLLVAFACPALAAQASATASEPLSSATPAGSGPSVAPGDLPAADPAAPTVPSVPDAVPATPEDLLGGVPDAVEPVLSDPGLLDLVPAGPDAVDDLLPDPRVIDEILPLPEVVDDALPGDGVGEALGAAVDALLPDADDRPPAPAPAPAPAAGTGAGEPGAAAAPDPAGSPAGEQEQARPTAPVTAVPEETGAVARARRISGEGRQGGLPAFFDATQRAGRDFAVPLAIAAAVVVFLLWHSLGRGDQRLRERPGGAGAEELVFP